MDKLKNIKKRQEKEKAEYAQAESFENAKGTKKKKRTKRQKALLVLARIVIIAAVLVLIAMSGLVVWATWGMDFTFEEQFCRTGMNLTSVVYYEDENGEHHYFERLIADQNRIWVDSEKVPQHLKDAFVAIEDQRFYEHMGIDIKRTFGAVMNVLFKGDSEYGGSTITQQLVKNMTADTEHSNARKAREMVRSSIVEFKMSKEEILELYMNSIYLGHGANGVQVAAKVYFNKDVKDLTLLESAAIAGITKYPSLYDPIEQPGSNKERRQLVLDKMLELGYISQSEHDLVYDKELDVISPEEAVMNTTQSYFVDHLYEELLNDLINEKGYTKAYATDLIYNGGLKIIATVDPEIQGIMDDVYANGNGFPVFWGEAPQSAMVLTEPHTGHIKGIVGGTGKKEGARVLNRASQSRRQPGSTIKPIAVYGPAIDTGTITLASTIANTPLKIGNWKPNNANRKFSKSVSVRTAVASSLNLPAIRVLEELTVDKSFEYMTERLHIQLVDYRKAKPHDVTDKGLAPLALGGLTDGVTVLELNSAYATFANGGEYVQPISYSKVFDANGELLIENTPERNRAFSEETAFIVTELLTGVIQGGTAAGYGMGNGIQTCGKTGSTDSNYDRWFAGFTPYYSATVWVGYDEHRVISYGGNNPALTIWHTVMKKVHENYKAKKFVQPVGVDKVFTCSNTGQFGTSRCSGTTDYVNTRLMTGFCSGVHTNYIGTPGEMPEEEEEEEKEGEEGEENTGENPEGQNPDDPSAQNPETQNPETSDPSTQTPEVQEPVTQEPQPQPVVPQPAEPQPVEPTPQATPPVETTSADTAA